MNKGKNQDQWWKQHIGDIKYLKKDINKLERQKKKSERGKRKVKNI